MTDKERFLHLLDRYVDGTSTSEEHEEFFRMLVSNDYDEIVASRIVANYHQNTEGAGDIPPHIAQEIMRNILSSNNRTEQVLPVKRPRAGSYRWLAAACLIGLIIAGAFLYNSSKQDDDAGFAGTIPVTDIIKKNDTEKLLKVVLSDQSEVVLEPGSIIYYPVAFSNDVRELYLEGDAHFDVSHQPGQPFMVYCKNIVTKVLGTRFDIINNKNDGNVEVSVKSGRVQVFENNKRRVKNQVDDNALILTANQRAIYTPETRRMVYTLVEQPVTIPKAGAVAGLDSLQTHAVNIPTESSALVYDEASLAKVFEDIEDNYGIEIELENPAMKNCVFTGDVRNKDLFVLLKIVCLSTNSDYEVNGTKILIKGRGCK